MVDSNNLQVVLFSYANPFVDSLRLDTRSLPIFKKTLTFRQRWTEGGKGGTEIGFGASVYNCSIVLALYLESNFQLIRNKIVLELGCGPGLVSIAAACAGAKGVIMTDGDEGSVSLAAENSKENGCSKCVNPGKFYWGSQEDENAVKTLLSEQYSVEQFDVILAADVVAVPYADAYSSLIDVMHGMCRPGGTVILAYQQRHASESVFFDMWATKFDVIRLPDSAVHSDFAGLPIAIYKATPLHAAPAAVPPASPVAPSMPPMDLQASNIFSPKNFPDLLSPEQPKCPFLEIRAVSNLVYERANTDSGTSSRCSSGGSTAGPTRALAVAEPQTKFPLLLTKRLALRDMRTDDAGDMLHLYRSLAAVPGCVDKWGGRLLPEEGGLHAAVEKIEGYDNDRREKRNLNWGVSILDDAAAASGSGSGNSKLIGDGSDSSSGSGDSKLAGDGCDSSSNGKKNECISESSVPAVQSHPFSEGHDLSNSDTLYQLTSNRLLGIVGFWRVVSTEYTAELGYILHPSYWGHGYMTEAVEAVVAYGFLCMGLHSIEANADPRNEGSKGVLRRAGFTQAAHFRENYYHDNVFKDSAIFRLLKKDWLRREAGLGSLPAGLGGGEVAGSTTIAAVAAATATVGSS